ncbi:XdhC family protein [Paraburkholderia nemoris]|uniref:XdhC family protein n=1 Tax=Paraburkholderia nemoris TaxID=2793076 RepID=UPI0038BAA946
MEDLGMLVLRAVLRWQPASPPVVLVTIARTWGSSSRPSGSLMAINEKGETIGSASGGIEDDLIDQGRADDVQAVCSTTKPALQRYGISDDDAHREGRHDGVPRLENTRLSPFLEAQACLVVTGAGNLSSHLCQMAMSFDFERLVCEPREHRSDWHLDGVIVNGKLPENLLQRWPDARTAVVAPTQEPKSDDLVLIDALQSNAFYVGTIGSLPQPRPLLPRLSAEFTVA